VLLWCTRESYPDGSPQGLAGRSPSSMARKAKHISAHAPRSLEFLMFMPRKFFTLALFSQLGCRFEENVPQQKTGSRLRNPRFHSDMPPRRREGSNNAETSYRIPISGKAKSVRGSGSARVHSCHTSVRERTRLQPLRTQFCPSAGGRWEIPSGKRPRNPTLRKEREGWAPGQGVNERNRLFLTVRPTRNNPWCCFVARAPEDQKQS